MALRIILGSRSEHHREGILYYRVLLVSAMKTKYPVMYWESQPVITPSSSGIVVWSQPLPSLPDTEVSPWWQRNTHSLHCNAVSVSSGWRQYVMQQNVLTKDKNAEKGGDRSLSRGSHIQDFQRPEFTSCLKHLQSFPENFSYVCA